MSKAAFKFYSVILISLFVEVCVGCKVGIFDVCNTRRPHLHHRPRRTKEFLNFQNAGDIERMTVSKNDILMEISFINGGVIHKNHDGFVGIQGTNNESITVNINTLEATAYATNGIGKMTIKLNITEVGASYANETMSTKSEDDEFLSLLSTSVNENNEVTINSSYALIVFRKVFDAPHGIGAQLRRTRAPNVDILISGYQNSTVYERRDSDDVYLMMVDGDRWEEMYIQPAELLIRCTNYRGTLYFRPDRAIRVNAWDGVKVSGSPFGKKIGRVTEGNVTKKVTFAANGCGRLKVAERSGSRMLIAHVHPAMLFVVDKKKNTSLEIEPHKHFHSTSSRGIVKVDLEKRIIQMEDFANGSTVTHLALVNETKKWAGAAGSVEHFDERLILVEDYDYVDEDTNDTTWLFKPVSSFTWRMNVELGSIEFPTDSDMPKFRFASANQIIANVDYTGDGVRAKDAAGEMTARCHHNANLEASEGGVRMNGPGSIGSPSFSLKNEPGDVHMSNNEATVRGHCGMVTISPFKIDIN